MGDEISNFPNIKIIPMLNQILKYEISSKPKKICFRIKILFSLKFKYWPRRINFLVCTPFGIFVCEDSQYNENLVFNLLCPSVHYTSILFRVLLVTPLSSRGFVFEGVVLGLTNTMAKNHPR